MSRQISKDISDKDSKTKVKIGEKYNLYTVNTCSVNVKSSSDTQNFEELIHLDNQPPVAKATEDLLNSNNPVEAGAPPTSPLHAFEENNTITPDNITTQQGTLMQPLFCLTKGPFFISSLNVLLDQGAFCGTIGNIRFVLWTTLPIGFHGSHSEGKTCENLRALSSQRKFSDIC